MAVITKLNKFLRTQYLNQIFMKNKIGFLLLFYFLFLQISPAAEIDLSTAQKVAVNFYYKNAKQFTSIAFYDIKVTDSRTVSSGQTVFYYIFNINNSAFVIVSADDAMAPVLAYSFEGTYGATELPPALVNWMESYKSQVSYIKNNNAISNPQVKEKWAYYLSSDILNNRPEKRASSVSPLLKTRWDQVGYYNQLCPYDSNADNDHVPAGCVATAVAQILKYYEYPQQGSGSHSINDWRWPGLLIADFGNTTYDYSKMPNILHTDNTDVARIIFHCGIAVDMFYTYSGSSATLSKVPNALLSYFKYRSSEYITRNEVSTKKWLTLLTDNLELGEPVLYSGSGSEGHAFVCDGYQDGNYFHFNWGWGGAYNGYFSIDSMNPGDNNFASSQTAVFNIAPLDYKYCDGTKILTDSTAIFDDGSGASYYLKNTDCSWLISLEDNTKRISLSFLSFKTEDGKDVLSVYNGETNQAPLIGRFSGNQLPADIISASSKLFLEFSTDSSDQNFGWVAKYEAALPGSAELVENAANVSIYPNPASNYLNCTFNNITEKQVKVKLLSLVGKCMFADELKLISGKSEIEIDISGIPAGIYIFTVNYGDNQINKKIIIK